jgi:hydroxyethylthiazole kinase-like uncharacterized protein yjeF
MRYMKFSSSEDIKKIENYCISNLGISELLLMENAAIKVLNNVNLQNNESFVLVCGSGNNGGDGFAVARHLFALDKKVQVFFVGNLDKMSKGCEINYKILKNMGIKVSNIIASEDMEDFKLGVLSADVVIDSILGTGLKREITGIYALVISIINENSKYIVSIDVPTGIDSNNGNVLGTSVMSNRTVTFQLYKKGFFKYGSDKYTGDIVVENIGIPKAVIDRFVVEQLILDRNFVRKNIKVREKYGHKGDFGRVLIFAGTYDYAGAAYICTEGAIKTGAGLVTLCCPKDILEILRGKLTEAMTVSLDNKEKVNMLLEKTNVIALGPGMGNTEETFKLVSDVVKTAQCPIVLDADAINALSKDLTMLNSKKNEIVLTPHLGEMSRLTGFSIDYINNNRITVAKEFAKEHGVTLLLKGYNTVITNGEIIYVNPTGNSAMASGGMGDCLTGIISALIAEGLEPIKAASVGAYIHGSCGEKLSEKMFSVNVTELLKEIPYVIKEIIS